MLVLEKLRQYAGASRVALVNREKRLTHRQLEERSGAFAAWLLDHLGEDRSPVVIYGEKETDFLCCMLGALKSGRTDDVYNDIKAVVDAANGTLTKVIIETCYLTDEEKVAVCKLAQKAGADFVKTSTGFGTGGANAHDVKLMKDTVGDTMKVKASGGMRTYEDVVPVLEAGADRLGVSASIAICEGAPE